MTIPALTLQELLTIVATPTIIGAGAALLPGPLLVVLIRETMWHGWHRGLMVAFAPLLSDIPAVILSFVFIGAVVREGLFFAIVALVGAIYLGYFGWSMFRAESRLVQAVEPLPVKKIVMINITNPHVWAFWFLSGAPLALSISPSIMRAVLFVLVFYVCMVATKVFIVFLIAKGVRVIRGTGYGIWTKALALAVIAFGVKFFLNGLKWLGVL